MGITRRLALTALGGGIVAGTLGGTLQQAWAADPKLGVVVKIGGIPWFNAMEVGIKKAAPELKVDAWMVGPTQADAAQQVRAIEDLIARKVDVIGIVPTTPRPSSRCSAGRGLRESKFLLTKVQTRRKWTGISSSQQLKATAARIWIFSLRRWGRRASTSSMLAL